MPYSIIKDKYLRVVFGLSFLIIAFNFIFAAATLWDIESPLILHFDVYNGIDYLGGKWEVFGTLIAIFLILLINLFLSDFLYHRERFLSFIFGFTSLVVSILILIGISVIISVN
ncbi:hypothetical protein HY227_02015 [Candidatus Wolfebacteria bacterium]|nr:hypothetical protein [Candidatus Wolfebacteria bacterium]